MEGKISEINSYSVFSTCHQIRQILINSYPENGIEIDWISDLYESQYGIKLDSTKYGFCTIKEMLNSDTFKPYVNVRKQRGGPYYVRGNPQPPIMNYIINKKNDNMKTTTDFSEPLANDFEQNHHLNIPVVKSSVTTTAGKSTLFDNHITSGSNAKRIKIERNDCEVVYESYGVSLNKNTNLEAGPFLVTSEDTLPIIKSTKGNYQQRKFKQKSSSASEMSFDIGKNLSVEITSDPNILPPLQYYGNQIQNPHTFNTVVHLN